MDIAALHAAYAVGQDSPEGIVAGIYDQIEEHGLKPVWISLVPREAALARAAELANQDRRKLPLYGIPFAAKDKGKLFIRSISAKQKPRRKSAK